MKISYFLLHPSGFPSVATAPKALSSFFLHTSDFISLPLNPKSPKICECVGLTLFITNSIFPTAMNSAANSNSLSKLQQTSNPRKPIKKNDFFLLPFSFGLSVPRHKAEGAFFLHTSYF
jgi:hypothetical protein